MTFLSPSILALAAAVVATTSGAQEPIVPALSGVSVAQLQASSPPVDRAALERQIQTPRTLQQSRQSLSGAVVPSAGSPLAEVTPPTVTAPVVASQSTAAVQPAPAAQAPAPMPPRKATPRAPTEAEVAAMERRLAIARSQVRARSAVESGTVRGDRASYVRAKVVFPYYDKSIFEVHTSPERMTTIELQPGEKITTTDGLPKAADTVNWIVSTVESGEGPNKVVSVLVKPREPEQETNLLIPTNRRSYYVVLRADSQAYMPIVGFQYPYDEARAEQARVRVEEAEETRKEAVSVPPDQIRFGYQIQGSDVVWKPLRVFDDGSKTYIQMPPSMRSSEAPALFVMDDEKEALLVNYRLKGDYYIVDRLFARAQLRVGKKNAVDIFRDDRPRPDGSSLAGWFSRD
jgi:P-type conjugative transfer protein TrbG